MLRIVASIACLFAALLTLSSSASACRKVGPVDFVKIDDAALKSLAAIGIDRERIFDALEEVSIPETGGCWAAASGNFDGQLVSIGALQWNFGKGSLQPMLARFKTAYRGRTDEIAKLMPQYGKLVFSSGCLRQTVTKDCNSALLALQTGNHLDSQFESEMDALFESDQMIQIQTDRFVALLGSVRDDLERLFPGTVPSARVIKWAVDTKTQQGSFPGNADAGRMRAVLKARTSAQLTGDALSLVEWYEGLCTSLDQGGVRLDCAWNVDHWRSKLKQRGIDPASADLLYLSFLRSRTAVGESGYWQALTFQRRAKIVLGVGSVGGEHVGAP